jgi:hypothetical protein
MDPDNASQRVPKVSVQSPLRVLKKTLRIFAGFVCLAILCFVALMVYRSVPRTDTFYVINADFAEPAFFAKLQAELQHSDQERAFLARHELPTVFAHRIVAGTNTVIAYRWFTPGSPLVIDDEGFEKITVSLPSVTPQGLFEGKIVPNGPVVAIVTRGGSAWPQRACSWRVEDGTVSIEVKGSSYDVHVTGRLKAEPPSMSKASNCTQEILDKRFEAKRLSLSEVTPWLGKQGDHPYAETYP